MSKEELYKLIDDRFEAWELVEMLEGITAEDICRAFEDEIDENMEAIKELLDLDVMDEGLIDEESSNYDETD
jgi:hypothetical protein